MRVNIIWFAFILAAMSSIALAADTPATPPVSPAAPGISMPGRPTARLIISSEASTSAPAAVYGTIMIAARVPRDLKIAKVMFFADDKPIGNTDRMPYKIDYDCTKISEGEHTFKAVGKDSDENEIWTASIKAKIDKSASSSAGVRAMPAFGARKYPTDKTARAEGNISEQTPSQPPSDVAPQQLDNPASLPTPDSPEKIQKEAADFSNKSDQKVDTSASADVQSPELTKTYSSEKYGFTIKYPTKWIALDKTGSVKPKVPGGLWIVFGKDPVNKSSIIINVRRQALEAGTNADTFATYNDYVNNWERKTVLGSTAFVTSSGSSDTKRVVHRMIIIMDGSAWMLNCTDTSGESPAESKTLFESMVNTLQVKTQPAVKVTEVKK